MDNAVAHEPQRMPIDRQAMLSELGEIKVKWAKVPSLMSIKGELNAAQPYHQAEARKISEWLDSLHVRQRRLNKKRKGRSQVNARLIRKQAEWRYSSLSEPFLAPTDLFKASPITYDDKLAARQNQLVLNHQFTHRINRGEFIDEYVRTVVDEGTVIVKCGWDYEDETIIETVPVFEFEPNEAAGQQLQQIAQIAQTNLNQFEYDVPDEWKQALEISQQTQIPHAPVPVGEKEEERVRIIKNQPTTEICDYRNVVIDPSCNGDLQKAKIVFHSFESSIADLEKDGRYFNLDKINTETSAINGDPDHYAQEGSRDFNFHERVKKRFVVWECWTDFDIDGKGLLTPIVMAWVDGIYVRMDLNPYPDQMHPFVKANYMPVRKSVYGEPDGELLKENQQIITGVTRGMIDILGRSANAQTGTANNFLDAANRRRFDRGEDYTYNGGIDPSRGVFMHKYEEIPQSAQYVLNQQNADAESLTGVKAFYGGLNQDSLGDVAASVKGVLDSASRRELGILRRLANGIVQIGRKFATMNGEFLSDKEVVRLTNEEFVAVRRDELNGEFDLKLDISSAEEDNVKAQELAFMLQTTGNNQDYGVTQIMLGEMFRLRKMPELAKKVEEYQPSPEQQQYQQEMQQLEKAKLEAEIELIRSQALENQSEAALDQAKIGTEQAKAEDLQAGVDNKSLDYVEKESGVTQERDLQKAQAQAQGNMELERLKQGYNRGAKREEKELDIQGEFLKSFINQAPNPPKE